MDQETESKENNQDEYSIYDSDSDSESVCSTTSSSSLPVGKSSLKVFIKRFPPSVTRRDIKDHLSICGVPDHVKSIQIFYNKSKKTSKGCGYVEYAPASAGHRAMFKLNGSLLLGTHKLQATEFRDKRSKDAPSKSGRKQQCSKGKKTSPVSPTLEKQFQVSCHTSASPQSLEEEASVTDPDSASGDSWKVFVGSLNSKQLPKSIQHFHLLRHFKDFESHIVQAFILKDKETKQSKGCGFVQFRSKEAAQAAIDKLHGSQLHGCTLKLEFARKRALSKSEPGTRFQKTHKNSTPTTTVPFSSPRKGQGKQVEPPPTSCTYSHGKMLSTSATLVGLSLHGEESPPEEHLLSTEACRVFVGGLGKSRLPKSVHDHHLHDHFLKFKPAILNAYIARHKETKQSKGHGFILFVSREVAQRAIAELNGSTLMGCKIKVQYDKSDLKTSTFEMQPSLHAPQRSNTKPSWPASDIVQEVIELSSGQWNLLTAIKTESSLYQELSKPFKSNPDVKIELLHEDIAIRFEGKADAVKSAHSHFSTQLKCYIPLEMEVVMALLSIFPMLHKTLMKKHSVTLLGINEGSTLLKLDGHTSDIVEARNYIDTILAHYQKSLVSPQIPLTATLLTSARKRLKVQNIAACLLAFEGSPDVTVCSFSPDDHERAVKIVSGKLLVVDVPFQSSELLQHHPKFQKVEKEHSVVIKLNKAQKRVHISGYVHEDMQSAFESVNSLVSRQSVQFQLIACGPEQMQYLQYKLRFTDEVTKQILASLPAKIIAKDKRPLYLKGSPKDIEKAQKMITEGPLLQGLRYCSFSFRAHHKSFTQIEQHVLKPIQRKNPNFVYAMNDNKQRNDGGSSKTQERMASLRGEEMEFEITIMSQDSTVYEEATAALEAVNLCSRSLKVKHTDARECVRERIRDTEQRYRVQIVVPKQSNVILIFGLTEVEAMQCMTELSEYIDSTVIIRKFIPLNCYEAKYLQCKKSDKLQGLRRKCQFLKVLDQCEQEEMDRVLIQVEGTGQQVRLVEQGVHEMIGDSFTVKSFTVVCKTVFNKMWQKRWKDIKKEKEQCYDIIVQFSRKAVPEVADQDRLAEYEFAVFGTDQDGAEEVKEIICNQDNGLLTKEKRVHLPPEAIKTLMKGLSGSDFYVHDHYTVDMSIDSMKHQVILTAPQECCDDLVAVEVEIQRYIGNRALTEKEIPINDPVIGLMLQSKTMAPSYLTLANRLAQPFGVSVHCMKWPHCGLQLRGCPDSISQVEPLIFQQIVAKIQSKLGQEQFSIDPSLRPFFSTLEFTHLNDKLRNDLCVVGTFPVLTMPNKAIKSVYLQATSKAHCIKLDICKGNIVNERVDAIVNATNEDLYHAEGVAKAILEAGGDEIQQKSTHYILMHGKQQTGSVVCLSAGKLSCKRIIHAVVPHWMGGNSGEEQILRFTVFRALLAAQEEQLESIAMPAIGMGAFGIPDDVCVQTSLKAVQVFCQTYPRSCINNIRFVLFQQYLVDLFCEGVDSGALRCVVQEEQHHKELSPKTSCEYTWLWTDDCGSYTPYSIELNTKLNYEFNHNPQGHMRFTRDGSSYRVDFKTMKQTNENTNHRRRVIQIPITSDNSQQSIQWHFTDDSEKLVAYTPQDSNAIERMFIAGKPSPLTIRGRVYSFDFKRMCQINIHTCHMRPIVRKTSINETKMPNSELPAKYIAYEFPEQVKKRCVVILRGPQTNLLLAKNKLEQKLKAALKNTKIYFPFGLVNTITKILQQHELSFEIQSADEVVPKGGKKFQKIVSFQGLAHIVHQATSVIQEEIISYQASAAEIEEPTDWQPQTANLELFPLIRNSMEWNKVKAHFRATLPNHIHQIYRIQNKWLWERYAQHKQRLAYKNNGVVNEKELFHGTRHNDPKLIYEGEDGFDMRFSAQGKWGLANYFAVNASYSNAYAYQVSNGYREIFLVKVLTGDSCPCAANSSLRLPPEKPGGASGSLQFSRTRYDTVTGTTGGSRVYMTYDNDKAYPAYLIQYRS